MFKTFLCNCLHKKVRREFKTNYHQSTEQFSVTVVEFNCAKNVWILDKQNSFTNKKDLEPIKKKLNNACFDENYLLCCYGRMKKESVLFDSKGLILLNRNNKLTELLASHIHLKSLHFN